MRKVIHCTCGHVVEGTDDEDLVRNAQEHARGIHAMELTTEQALSMARPE